MHKWRGNEHLWSQPSINHLSVEFLQERWNVLTCQDESCATFCPAFIIRCVVSLTVWAFTLILKSYHLMVGKSSVSGGDYWRWKNLFHKALGLLINPSVFIPPLLPTPAVTGKCWVAALAGLFFFLNPQFWCLLHNAQRRKLNVSVWVLSLTTLTIIAVGTGDRAEEVLGEKRSSCRLNKYLWLSLCP